MVAQWQPISTAVKDQRVVQLFDRVPFYGAWDGTEWRPAMPSRELDGQYGVWANARTVQPTHWMPLPESPEPGA